MLNLCENELVIKKQNKVNKAQCFITFESCAFTHEREIIKIQNLNKVAYKHFFK